jgi:hypothetical protein
MSDFSELCPLFNTGVYSELCLGPISFTAIAPTMNALAGAVVKTTKPGSLKFDRTVVVTKVFCQKVGAQTSGIYILANHHKSTGTATGTVFASIKTTSTTTLFPIGQIRAMTQAANKTFLAADVLGFCAKTVDAADAIRCNFIVRYKEK